MKTLNIDQSYNKPLRKVSYREENAESQQITNKHEDWGVSWG
jgi:hypothetical protein